jgi:predicted metal-dependent RNase
MKRFIFINNNCGIRISLYLKNNLEYFLEMSRKKAEDNEDLLVIKPLGAGQEVGRSCILLEFKGKKVMV